MLMPGRRLSLNDYKFGFNGKEMDKEISGIGNSYDYGARIYDSRLGRLLSVDPLFRGFPWNSTYAYAENDVIRCIDVDGLEKSVRTIRFSLSNGAVLSTSSSDNYVQPTGTFRIGFKAQTTKEIISKAMVSCMGIPGNGQFVFYEFEGAPTKNSASYFYTDDKGNAHVYKYSSGDVNYMYEQYGIAQSNFNKWLPVAGAAGNLALAGSLVSAELKGLSAETKAMTKDMSSLDMHVAKTADDIAYLDKRGAEAIYMSTGETSGFMLIREGASRMTVLEESIHHLQKVKYGEKYFLQNNVKLEIEAQNELLEIGKSEGWSASEMDRINRAKATWESKLPKKKE
jgi:RHS repeat-associated protein